MLQTLDLMTGMMIFNLVVNSGMAIWLGYEEKRTPTNTHINHHENAGMDEVGVLYTKHDMTATKCHTKTTPKCANHHESTQRVVEHQVKYASKNISNPSKNNRNTKL